VAVGGVALIGAALGVGACGGLAPSGRSALSTNSTNKQFASAKLGSNTTVASTEPLRSVAANDRASTSGAKPDSAKQSPSSPAWLMASAEAAQGWIAATNAFANASYTDDWNSPALVATEEGPELGASQSALHSLSDAGIVARGTPQILSVQVTSVGKSFAQVLGCVGGDQIHVYLSTGLPVPGRAGQASLGQSVSADLVQTTSGWKVQKQSTGGGKCSPG
jgi:hypothetical protein